MVQIKFWKEKIKSLTYPPITQENLNSLEVKIGYQLPKSYISLMLVHDGGFVLKDSFVYHDNNRQIDLHCGIGMMLHSFSGENSIYNMLIDPPEFFPEKLVPFAEDGGGNFICFDYRQYDISKEPPIVCWIHDDPQNYDIHFVANNFEEFVNMLCESEDW